MRSEMAANLSIEFLALRPDTPAPLALLSHFHEEHQQKAYRVPTSRLRQLPCRIGVVAFSGLENAYDYRITQHGIEFLSYIRANYPANWNQCASNLEQIRAN